MNPFFLAVSTGFLMVVLPLGWYLFNLMKDLGIEVQVMLIGVLVLLASAVLYKLKSRFGDAT